MMKAQRAASVRRKKKINWKLESPLHIMMLPSIILLAIFCYYPMYGNIMAFQNFNPGLGFTHSPWAGLKYFRTLFALPDIGQVL